MNRRLRELPDLSEKEVEKANEWAEIVLDTESEFEIDENRMGEG